MLKFRRRSGKGFTILASHVHLKTDSGGQVVVSMGAPSDVEVWRDEIMERMRNKKEGA